MTIDSLRHWRHALSALTCLAVAACAASPQGTTRRGPTQEAVGVAVSVAEAAPADAANAASAPGAAASEVVVPAAAGAVTPVPEATTDGSTTTFVQPAAPPAGLAPEQYPDLFDRIRAGFKLADVNSRDIDIQLDWFANNPEYLERTFSRAELYLHHIVKEIEARGMPLELALLPVVESAFEPYAYSRSSAAGLWQFIPGTGSRFGLKQDWWYDGRRDVTESTRAALDYLQYLHDEFNGDWLLAIAGYNCGEQCVERAVHLNQKAGKPIDFWSLRLPAETRAYVPKLLAMRRLVANPANFGIAFSPIQNEPYFVRVETGGQIDMKVAAELAGLSYEELFELNPAYHRWATDPAGPHYLLMPADAADLFRENLAQLDPDQRMRVTRYRVKRSDTVASIARQFKTQTLVVRALNDLGAKQPLVVGTDLRVPSGMSVLPPKVLLAAARADRRVGPRALRRPVIHVVRAGDSLWAIARRHRIDVRTLASLNNMQPGDPLRAGQRLVLAARKRGHASGGSRAQSHRPLTYTVRTGDTLSRIARLFQVSVAQILSWNGAVSQGSLRPGQRLTINVTRDH